MKPPPLAVKNYFFPEVHFQACRQHDPAGESMGTVIEAAIEHVEILADGDLYYQIKIFTDMEKSTNAPFDFSIITYGIFKPCDEKAAHSKMAHQLAFSTLVGAAREHIATLSSKTPWAKFMLPPLVIPEAIFEAKGEELNLDKQAE